MGTSRNIEKSYKTLKNSLNILLHGKRVDFTDCPGSPYPFIVLETLTDSVGFCIIYESPQKSFSSAYDGFKLCYRQNHSDWQQKSLSFVICRMGSVAKDDGFFSTIETDVYFCRKYVIGMNLDQKVLCNELSRLPFLPIQDKDTSTITLPPSAQTLLQSINVSATVARQIVVPMEYSAQNIFRNLLNNADELPELNIEPPSFASKSLKPSKNTRVKEISIEAFRAYKKNTVFNLDSDIVVLYGPNGLGKTSFFDAIDYACTGRIGRFCRGKIAHKKFISLARHLSADHGLGMVELTISRENSNHHLKRHVDNWRYAHMGNEKYDRANLLQFLTAAKWSEKKPRIEKIERLFRSTHLFNQTDSELFTGFSNESILSSDIVSRMLALDDYASGKLKISQVIKICRKKIFELNSQVKSLNLEINDANIELEKLPKSSTPDKEKPQIKILVAQYLSDFNLKTKLKINEQNISNEAINECRALTEASLKENQKLLDGITSLIEDFDIYETTTESIDKNKTTLVSFEQSHSETKSKLKLALKDLEKKKIELKKNESSLSFSNKKIFNLAQMPNLQQRVKGIKTSLNLLKQQLNESEKEIQNETKNIQKLTIEKKDIVTFISSHKIQIRTLTQLIELLREILNEAPQINQDKNDIQKLKQNLASDKNHIKKIIINEKNNIRSQREQSNLLNEKKAELNRLSKDHSDISKLLDEIECHVVNSHCPTCGFDHGSKQVVIEKIRAQKESRPFYIENLVKECNTIDKELRETIQASEKLQRQKKNWESSIETSESEINLAENRIIKFHQKIEKRSININSSNLSGKIKTMLSDNLSDLNQIKNKFEKLQNDLRNISEKQELYEKNRSIHLADMKKAKNESDILYGQLNECVKESEKLGWNIDTEQIELEKFKLSLQKDIKKFSPAIKKYEIDINNMEHSIKVTENFITTIQKDIESTHKNINEAQNKANKFFKEYYTYTGSKIPNLDDLGRIKNNIENDIKQLQNLKDRAIFLELAVDSAEKSALIVQLETLIKQKNNKMLIKTQEIKQTEQIYNWITKIENVLGKQSSIAVDNYVSSFGPLTSVIQKRLRAVYGFSDVYLKAKRDEIQVNVDYAKKAVLPTDYFSDSQKQILMLSLFLSGRLTQNWSGFAPILLDDPVTHFDDLNAFGFVELIRGLVSLSPGKRQFFISTCDNRLFDLMKSKFGGTHTQALFYRFEGIDSEGPIIEPV